MKEVLKRVRYIHRNRRFKPYLKQKNVEGVAFDFWIGDRDGRDWYDIHCTDPEWTEMRFIRDHMICEGDVILECGGHHGCTAIVLSTWVGDGGKVITFEPLPKNCDIIQRNIDQNSLKNVTLKRKAVGAESGKITINDVSNSSVAMSGKGVEVEMTCLDEYENLSPTFIKIDVEGFGEQVLRGAMRILKKRPKLAIEIHTEALYQYDSSVEELFRLIGIEDYELWIQWEDGKQPEKYDIRKPIKKRVHLFGIPHKQTSVGQSSTFPQD